MKRSLLFMLCFITLLSFAQEEPVIVMTTTKPIGSVFEFELQPVISQTKVKIDYGDGILKETELVLPIGFGSIKDTLKGQTIKIYATPTDILKIKCESCGLTKLDVTKNKLLNSIVCYRNPFDTLDISQNPALINLYISETNISEVDVSQHKALLYLNVSNTNVSKIDVSKNRQLNKLWIDGTRISEVDLSQNRLLRGLDCEKAQLKQLDLTHNKELEELRCQSNKLTELDLSQNKKLIFLYCSDNPLGKLDLSNNTDLKFFECKSNEFTSLDLSNNTLLKELDCSGNPLQSLNLSGNKNLKELTCLKTPLTSLDLSGNPILENIDCSNNKLKILNISNNRLLKTVNCSGNELKELDISKNPALEYLDCNNNKLKQIDASQNKYLAQMYISRNDLEKDAIAALQGNEKLRRVDYSRQGKDRYKTESYRSDNSAQFGIAMDIGYSYKFLHGGLHQGYIGGELSISSDEKRPYSGKSVFQLLIGGGAYYGKYGGESKAIPAVSVGFTADPVCIFLVKATATKYSINPSFGINFLNLARLNLGYNFGYKKVNGFNMSGVSVSISILLGSKGYYVDPSS